jgi:lipid-A-disaccharide synthase
MTRTRYIIAGESSGDALAASLMRATDRLAGPAGWQGMGGPQMQAAGLVSGHDYTQLSLIGFGEALAAMPRLLRLAGQLAEEVMALRPSAVFTVDSKAFSMRFAKILRKKMYKSGWSCPIIHMVAPTVWAWGSWRKRGFEQLFDGLLCLFPFEPELFDSAAVKACFVGHPAAFTHPVDRSKASDKLIALFPGSRGAELDYILEDMLGAAERLWQADQERRFMLPAVPHLADRLAARLARAEILPVQLVTGPDAARRAFTEAGSGLLASGTASLQAALAGMPVITCYKVGAVNYRLMRWLFHLPDPILPNILLGRVLYPFFGQSDQTSRNLAAALEAVLADPQGQAATLNQAAAELRALLTGGHVDFDASLQAGLAEIRADL